jgi:hypothetical protein
MTVISIEALSAATWSTSQFTSPNYVVQPPVEIVLGS